MFHHPYFWDSAQHEWLKRWFDKREMPEQMFGWWKIGDKSRLDSLLDELRMTSDLQPSSQAAHKRWIQNIKPRTKWTLRLEWSCG